MDGVRLYGPRRSPDFQRVLDRNRSHQLVKYESRPNASSDIPLPWWRLGYMDANSRISGD